MSDHIHGWHVARQAVEGVEIEPDGGNAVIIPLASKSVATNAVEHLSYRPIPHPIVNLQWVTIAKPLESGGALGLTAQLADFLDMDWSAISFFQVPFQFTRLNLIICQFHAHCPTPSMN
jgi:hypothetical protein